MSETASAPIIAAIIVNYRSAELVLRHFPMLKRELAPYPGARVYIVDNASPGDDAAQLSDLARREAIIEFIASPENGGFAKGNNLAIRRALASAVRPDFIFLLNPDAYPRPGAVSALVDFLAKRPKAGFAGARLEAEDGTPHVSAFRFFSVIGEFESGARTGIISRLLSKWRVAPPQRNESAEADWLCGAGLMIRTEVFERVGLFDDAYFLYYEETDLMRAARQAGFEVWYAPTARVVHYEGGSSGLSQGSDAQKETPIYWYQSRAHYYRKNHGAFYAGLADAAWLAGAALYWMRLAATGKDRREMARAVKRFVKLHFGGGLSKSEAEDRPQ